MSKYFIRIGILITSVLLVFVFISCNNQMGSTLVDSGIPEGS